MDATHCAYCSKPLGDRCVPLPDATLRSAHPVCAAREDINRAHGSLVDNRPDKAVAHLQLAIAALRLETA